MFTCKIFKKFSKGIFNKFANYCHGTTSFISQINENLLLDIGLREEIEETMTLLVDDRMSFFKKKNFYSKNLSTLIENTENINFQEISRKYGINLKTIFPNLARFSIF